jgi:glycosyltransferase involved in cell wall biosynthesis
VRIKALTALQNGLPIVSTKLGVDGLGLVENQHYLNAETSQEFANQVTKLLQNKALRDKISQAEIKHFNENYSIKNYLKSVN